MFFSFFSSQLFVAWIVDQTGYVNQANVVVILDMLVDYAINCPAMHDVLNMVNAKMAHAFAHKAGMDAIAHYVSFLYNLFNLTECGPFIPTLAL